MRVYVTCLGVLEHPKPQQLKGEKKRPQSSSCPQIKHVMSPVYLPHHKFQAQGPVCSLSTLLSSMDLPGEAKLISTTFPSPPPCLCSSWSLSATTQLGQALALIPLQAQQVAAEADIPPAFLHVGHQKTSISKAPFIPKGHTLQTPTRIPDVLISQTSETQNNSRSVRGKVSTPT